MKLLKSVAQQLLTLIRRHPILAGALGFLILVFAVFSTLIGFPQMLVLLAPVAVIAWLLLGRHLKKTGIVGGMSEAIVICSVIAVATVTTVAAIQLVPYGKSGTNPTNYDRKYEPDWDSPRTRELTVNACYGCHSNEVNYPSYSKVAPISWAVQMHVDEGRENVNFSLAKQSRNMARIGRESIETIEEGSMPPSYYTRFGKHPEARLTDAEKNELVQGLMKTFGVTASGDDREND